MPWGDVLLKPDPVTSKMAAAFHSEQELAWRQDMFQRMKFPLATAKWLAKSRVDIHQTEALLAAGCEHSLAIKILEGTCFSGEDDIQHLLPKIEIEEEADPEE